jgi:hypothetical protein
MYNTQEVSELNLKFKKYVSGVIIFSSVRFLSKKVTKTSFLKKKSKPVQIDLFRFDYFGKKNRFKLFWLSFFGLAWFFPVWLSFFGLAWFFSGFFSV